MGQTTFTSKKCSFLMRKLFGPSELNFLKLFELRGSNSLNIASVLALFCPLLFVDHFQGGFSIPFLFCRPEFSRSEIKYMEHYSRGNCGSPISSHGCCDGAPSSRGTCDSALSSLPLDSTGRAHDKNPESQPY